MLPHASAEAILLTREWIEQLRATEPGEIWWENLVDAITGQGSPVVPILSGYLGDDDGQVVQGVAAAIERIARSMRRRQFRSVSAKTE